MQNIYKALWVAGLGLLAVRTAQAQQGIGTGSTAPRTMLDVNGAVSVTETTAAISSNAATVPTGFSLVRLTGSPTATVALTGASSPAPVAGQLVTIYNPTAQAATFNSQTVPAGQSVAFVYSNGDWRAVGDGGAGVGANNGLTKATGNTIQLGGDLIKATTISNVTATNTLSVTGPTAADAAVTVGSTSGTAGRLQLGNSNHGILRDLSASKSVLDGTTAGNVNDVAVYTTNSGGGNLHLVANPSITGNTNLPLGQFTLTPSGYVGIGTPSPGARLQVVDNGNSGAGDDAVLLSYGDNANPAFGIQRVRGTATAPANLQAGDQMGVLGFSGRYNGAPGDFNLSSLTGYYQGNGTTAFSDLRLLTSGAERLRVDSVGRVGIGFAYPRQTLAVNGGLRINNYNGTNDAIRGQGAYLQWNRSNGEGETWLLNQRGGSTTAATGIRFGDVTNQNVVTEYGRFFYNGAFRLSAYGNNAATNGLITTSPVGYLGVTADGTLAQAAPGSLPNIYTADGSLQADRTVNLNGHPLSFVGSDGFFRFNNTGNTFSTSAKSLLITQTGDQYGSSSISLQNRDGQNGLLVTTANQTTGKRQVGVTDFFLQTQSNIGTPAYKLKQMNLRLDGRAKVGATGIASGNYIVGPFSASVDSLEVQIGKPIGTDSGPGLVVGNTYAIAPSYFGVGSGASVISSRMTVSPGTAESKITLYDGGVNGQTGSTAATTHYGFGVSSNNQLNYDVVTGASHVFYVNSKNGSGSEVLRANATGVSLETAGGPVLTITTTTAAVASVPANTSGNIYYETAGQENHVFGGSVVPNGAVANSLGLSSVRWPSIYGGNADLSGTLNATGAAALGGTLSVTGTTTLGSLALANGGSRTVMADANGQLSAVTATTANTPNIYSADGSLAAARTVTQGSNNLTFSGASSLIKYSGAANTNTSIVLGRTTEEGAFGVAANTNQYFGGAAAGDVTLRSSANNNLFVGTIGTANTILGTNNAERLRITSGGLVGINNSNPTYRLDVTGDIHASGNVVAGSTTLTSDRRLKTNVAPLTGGLATVAQLRPVQYDKKATLESSDYSRHELGFIAQEVRQVLPTLVSEGKDAGKTLAVSYTELIPVLTKAMQEQQAQIEALQAANAKLASENQGLKASLDGKASAGTVDELQAALQTLRAEVQALKAAGTTASTK